MICNLSIARLTPDTVQYRCVLSVPSGLLLGSVLSRRLRKELFEVLKEIWRRVEQGSYLGINFLYRLRLPLVSLQNLKKLLVNVGLLSITIL
jgi:hypothetical protein